MESLKDRYVMIRHLAGGLSLQQLADHLGTTPDRAASRRHQFLAQVQAVTISEPPAPADETTVVAPVAPEPWSVRTQLAWLTLVSGVLSLLALFGG